MADPDPTPNWDNPVLHESNRFHFDRQIWRWLTSIAEAAFGRAEPEDAASILVGASPFSYTATGTGNVLINGGTVTAVAIERMGVSYTVPATAAFIPMCAEDVVTVTYTVVPTLTFLPSW